MTKIVGTIKLKENDYVCNLRSGVTIWDGKFTKARISYTQQEIQLWKEISYRCNRYKGTVMQGCLFGPGTLFQRSNMTLKFVMK